MVDSTDFGAIGLESVDSFMLSLKQINNNRAFLKQIKLDTISNSEERLQTLKGYFMPFYELFHDTWIEFRNDSTVIEHIKDNNSGFADLKRKYEFNPATNHMIFDRNKDSEELLVIFLTDNMMILSFYREDLHLLVKKTD